MKIVRIILVLLLLITAIDLYAQQITYSAQNVPLKTVFAVIQKQTGFGFFYDQKLLSNTKPVSFKVNNASLPVVLRLIFKFQPLDYSIENKTILISKKKALVVQNVQFIYLSRGDWARIPGISLGYGLNRSGNK